MGMNFNLSNVTGTSMPKLAPNKIHEVIFKGITYQEMKNKKDEANPHRVMKARWENADGYYEETIWAPKEGDEKRTTTKKGDVERENPSNLERFERTLAHIGEQLAPVTYEKFKGLTFDLPSEFEKLAKTFIKVTEKSVNKAVKLKLVKNKKDEASLPYFVNLSKEGKAYISNNWLGDKVFFSPFEIEQMEKQTTAKPTNMPDEVVNDDLDAAAAVSDENGDIDFDV